MNYTASTNSVFMLLAIASTSAEQNDIDSLFLANLDGNGSRAVCVLRKYSSGSATRPRQFTVLDKDGTVRADGSFDLGRAVPFLRPYDIDGDGSDEVIYRDYSFQLPTHGANPVRVPCDSS